MGTVNSMISSVRGTMSRMRSGRVGRFFSKYGRKWKAADPQPKPERDDAAVTSVVQTGSPWDSLKLNWKTTSARKDVHGLMRRMCFEEDGIVAVARESIRDATLGPDEYDDKLSDAPLMDIEFTEAPSGTTKEEAEAYINKALKDCGFIRQLPFIIDSMLGFGNDFREVVIDTNENPPKILELKWLEEWTMWPKRHPVYGHRMRGYIFNNGEIEEEFPEQHIIHFKFGEDEYGLGKPLMYEERRNWLRLACNEDAVGLERTIRAHPRLLHMIPVPEEMNSRGQAQKIAAYRKAQTMASLWDTTKDAYASINAPQGVNTDFYLPQIVVRDPMDKS